MKPAKRVAGCFTNSYGPDGVETAVRMIRFRPGSIISNSLCETQLRRTRHTGIRGHYRRSRRCHRAAFCDLLSQHEVKVSGCNVGGTDLRTPDGVALTERRMRFREEMVRRIRGCLGSRPTSEQGTFPDPRRTSAPRRCCMFARDHDRFGNAQGPTQNARPCSLS